MHPEGSHDGEPIDLAREELYDSQGRRITEDYIAAAVAEFESDEAQLDDARAAFPPASR